MVRALLLALVLSACSGSGGGSSAASPGPLPSGTAQVQLLFMGNSHTSVNDVPGMVAALVKATRPEKTVEAVTAPTWMSLEDRAKDAPSLALLRSRAWKFVVLQAQDYSSSGLFLYPIDGAVSLVGESRKVGAVPILFPEWPRLGINETQRIYDLHLSIARQAPACVPPIPQAFDLSLARNPDIVLHAADGNHSAPAGAFLAALVIATTMTGVAPDTLPAITGFDIDAATQARLRSVAAETVLAYSPRMGCPSDPVGVP
jgi:hypothetical protein